jgi:hypothetical protein
MDVATLTSLSDVLKAFGITGLFAVAELAIIINLLKFMQAKTVPKDIYQDTITEGLKTLSDASDAMVKTLSQVIANQDKILFVLSSITGRTRMSGE